MRLYVFLYSYHSVVLDVQKRHSTVGYFNYGWYSFLKMNESMAQQNNYDNNDSDNESPPNSVHARNSC